MLRLIQSVSDILRRAGGFLWLTRFICLLQGNFLFPFLL
jgi:hypothetical protein